MKKLHVLVLTDHGDHSDQNSIYTILSEWSQDHRVSSLKVASRGIDENRAFFAGHNLKHLWTTDVTADFTYTEDGRYYKEGLHLYDKEPDLIFMRLPRPISDRFLLQLEDQFRNSIFINKPSGIIVTSNKAFLTTLPIASDIMWEIHRMEDIVRLKQKHPIVLKPLRSYGGNGILKLEGDWVDDGEKTYSYDSYRKNIKHGLEDHGYIAMKFLKRVSEGDKRILVVGNEVLGASLRKPSAGSWLCNVAQGGSSLHASYTEDEASMVKSLSPIMKQQGILIYGMDTLEDDNGKRVLSEINTLSVGGFMQTQMQSGQPVIQKLIKIIYQYIDAQR